MTQPMRHDRIAAQTAARSGPTNRRRDRAGGGGHGFRGDRGGHDIALARALLHADLASADDIQFALARRKRGGASMAEILIAHQRIDETQLRRVEAAALGVAYIDLGTEPPDPELMRQWGYERGLRTGLTPWRRLGNVVVIATARPDHFPRYRNQLRAEFGAIALAVAAETDLRASLLTFGGRTLTAKAEASVPARESCRDLALGRARLRLAAFLVAAAVAAVTAPVSVFMVLLAWAVIGLIATTALKATATIAAFARPAAKAPPPVIARLPRIAVLVPLYGEIHMIQRLLRRLRALDYPRELLEVVLVVEARDEATRARLSRHRLPPWIRVVAVPEGTVRTKPRALNFALSTCRGAIIGIYDAEDQPAPDQLRKVVARFHASDARLACVQGVLDFYNTQQNWMARCFTLEYAAWFRVILPGLARIGAPIPLGGTTVFLRRAVLEKLGRWDAHNVTEDADLGIRLARHGYRTELIDSVTAEEANHRIRPWINQRSRWIKGYMATWLTHMRAPRLLWRQLGAARFVAFQAMFMGTVTQALLAPVLWSIWLLFFGFYHPILALPAVGLGLCLALFLVSAVLNAAIAAAAGRRAQRRLLPLWVPLLAGYFALASLAAYKAAYEMVVEPFFWDKTPHGLIHDRRRSRHDPARQSARRRQIQNDPAAAFRAPLSRFSPHPHPASAGSRRLSKYAP